VNQRAVQDNEKGREGKKKKSLDLASHRGGNEGRPTSMKNSIKAKGKDTAENQ